MKIFAAAGVIVAIFAGSAFAQEGLDLDKIHAMRDEGKVHYNAAGNTDLKYEERNEHRKKAYDLLWPAYRILDQWCDEHPEDISRLEELCMEIGQMCVHLRKESPVGLLGDQENVRRGPPPDWGPPPADLHEPALPGPKPAPSNPEAAPVPAPAPRADPVEEHMAYAEKYAKDHPYDLCGIRDIYLDILDHAQPGGAAWVTALKRVSEMNSRMKDIYRRLRDEDPDQLEMWGAEERKHVHALSKDLKDREADVRLRAAESLGLLGSGDAARHLVKQFEREREEKVKEMILGALVRIGGSKVTEELADLRKSRDADEQRGALSVLAQLASRSDVEARYAAIAIGGFAFARDDGVAEEALDLLESLGPKGSLGLINAITIGHPARKLRVIRLLGDSGDGRAGAVLGNLLIFGAKGQLREYRDAAIESLKKIGMPAVPWLAPAADHPRLRQFAKFVLREITGRNFESGDAVRAWWSQYGK